MAKDVKKIAFDQTETEIGFLGREGENLWRAVECDVSSVLSDRPSATFIAEYRRGLNEVPFKLNSSLSGNTLTIDLSDIAMAFNGSVYLQIVAFDGKEVGRSKVLRGHCEYSIIADGHTPDSPYEDALLDIHHSIEQSEKATDAANTAAGKANQAATKADDSAQKADESVAKIPDTIKAALKESKDSGLFDGADGFSPIVDSAPIAGGHRVDITDAKGKESFNVLDGVKGDTGFAPVVDVIAIDGGHKVTITDDAKVSKFNVMDGISPTVKTEAISGGNKVTITDKNGSRDFNVMDGKDGFSPIVSTSPVTGGHQVNIQDKTHTESFKVTDGVDGKNGKSITEIKMNPDGTWKFTFDDGSTQNVTDEAYQQIANGKADKTYVDNTFANTLTAHREGKIISVDDVSPIQHEVKCKVSGEGVDLSSIMVYSYGNNLINENWTIGQAIDYETGEFKQSPFSMSSDFVPIGCAKIIYGKTKDRNNKQVRCYDVNKKYIKDAATMWGGLENREIHINNEMVRYIRITVVNQTAIPYYIMISLNDVPYEPFKKGHSFIPSEAGIIEGMTSVSPVMNIFSDNPLVTLSVDYNVDTNYFREKVYSDMCKGINMNAPVAKIHPVNDFPLDVTSQIVPVQLGSGEPSLTNVRNIVGNSFVLLNQSGENILHLAGREIIEDAESNNTSKRKFNGNKCYVGLSINNYFYRPHILDYSITEDSVYVKTRMPAYGIAMDVPVKPGEKYTIKNYGRYNSGQSSIGFGYYEKDGTYIRYEGYHNEKITIPENVYWIAICFVPMENTNNEFTFRQPQIIHSDNDEVLPKNPYYNILTHISQFKEEIFGGSYNWRKGVIQKVVRKEMINERPNIYILDANSNAESTLFYSVCSYNYKKGFTDLEYKKYAYSNMLRYEYIVDKRSTINGYSLNQASPGVIYIRLRKDTGIETVEQFKNFVKNNPMEFLVPIDTETIQTEKKYIRGIEGENILYSDSGDTQVSYLEDRHYTDKTYEDRLSALENHAVTQGL